MSLMGWVDRARSAVSLVTGLLGRAPRDAGVRRGRTARSRRRPRRRRPGGGAGGAGWRRSGPGRSLNA